MAAVRDCAVPNPKEDDCEEAAATSGGEKTNVDVNALPGDAGFKPGIVRFHFALAMAEIGLWCHVLRAWRDRLDGGLSATGARFLMLGKLLVGLLLPLFMWVGA